MKSKAEIVDAIKKCNDFVNHCSECPYNNNNSSEECIGELLNDTIILLNKSDFEVLSEIIKRGTGYDFCCHSAPGLIAGIELGNPDERYMPPVKIIFDKEGNII